MITCNDDDAVQSLVFLLFVYFPSSSLLTVAVMSDFVNTRMISVMVFVSESHSLRTFLSGILFGMSFHPSLHETCCLVFFPFLFSKNQEWLPVWTVVHFFTIYLFYCHCLLASFSDETTSYMRCSHLTWKREITLTFLPVSLFLISSSFSWLVSTWILFFFNDECSLRVELLLQSFVLVHILSQDREESQEEPLILIFWNLLLFRLSFVFFVVKVSRAVFLIFLPSLYYCISFFLSFDLPASPKCLSLVHAIRRLMIFTWMMFVWVQ